MAEPTTKSDDELLMEAFRSMGRTDTSASPGLLGAGGGDLFGDLTADETEALFAAPSQEESPAGKSYTDYDVHSALVDIATQVEEGLRVQHLGATDDEIVKMLDEKLWAVDQFPRHQALEMPDSPSVNKFRDFISENPKWLSTSPSKYMREIAIAVDSGKSDDEIEKIIDKAPISHMPDKLFEEQGLISAFRGAIGPRMVKVSAGSTKRRTPEMRWAERRELTREYDRIMNEEGNWEAFKKAWEGSMAMPLDEARSLGVVSEKTEGRVREDFFGRAAEDVDEDWFIPAGIKDIPDLFKRGITKLGIGDVFAPLVLDDKEYEQYKKEVKLATPTESWETIVRSVWNAKDEGKDANQIKTEMQGQLYASFMSNAYKDLPSSVRLGKPSVDALIEIATSRPDLSDDPNRPGLARLIDMVKGGASKSQIQEALESVPFGQLPAEIWAGNVKSLEGVIERIYEGAEGSIEAIKETGGEGSRELEKDFMDLLLTTEEHDGEIYVVESNIGRVLRLIGTATETVAEADIRIPGLEWASMTPASRDFYWNFGIRDPNSTYLARILANMTTGEVGFSRHLTDEAMARGYEQADPAFRMYSWVGLGLDFLVPWEKYHISGVTRPIRAVHRGYKANKLVGEPGFRGRAFLAGSSPHLYSYIYKTSERTQKSALSLQKRLGPNPSVASLKDALSKTGDDILGYNERWLATELVEKMEDPKKPLGFDKAIEKVTADARVDVFETVGDVAEAITRHRMDSPDGEALLRNLPWQFKREVDEIILASGADPSIVREYVNTYMGKSKRAHLASLEVLMRKGDPDTQILRSSDDYQKVLKQVNDLLDDGDIGADELPLLMAVLENRAYTLAADQAAKSIPEPIDFFKKVRIRRKGKAVGGEKWTLDVPKAGRKGVFVQVNASDMAPLVSIFRNRNLSRLLDDNGLALSRIMGEKWVNRLFKHVDSEDMEFISPEMKNRAQPSVALKPDGANALEELMRQFFFERTGQVGPMRMEMQELAASMAGIWMRARGSADLLVPDIVVRNFWDTSLSPDKVLANEAVGMANRLNGLVRVVRIAGKLEEAIVEELPARAGRKREFIGVEKHPDVVRQALGITEDTKDVSAVELYARAVGYAVGEHFKRHVGGMEFTKLTDWTYALPAKARAITKSVNGKMASVLGLPELTKDTLKGIFDPEEKVLNLNSSQQSSLRVHLRQLANEPIAMKRLPRELMDADADLGKITNVQLGEVIEIMKDVEGGAFSRRTHYSEAISRSLGYSILNVLKSASKDTLEASDVGRAITDKFNTWFTIEDPYLDTLGPMQKALVEKHLKKMQGVQQEVMEWIRIAVKEDPDRAIDIVYEKLKNHLNPTVEPKKASKLLGRIGQTSIPGQRVATTPRMGWSEFLNEFTNAEIKRNADDYAAVSQELDLPEAPAILRGKEEMLPSEYEFFDVSGMSTQQLNELIAGGGVSKLQYLLKRSTLNELEEIVRDGSKGMHGLTEREASAFAILGTYANKSPVDLAKLTDLQRVELADAIKNVQSSIDHQANYVKIRGEKIFLSLIGGGGEELLGSLNDARKAWFYTKFYEGGQGWIEMLDWLVTKAQREGGLWAERVPKYSPAQAFMEMIVRMRAYELLDGMADDMMRHGMPVKMQDFVQPRPRIGPKGDVISIDAGNQFNARVKHYITTILGTTEAAVQRVHRVVDEEGKVTTERGPIEYGVAPPKEAWAPGERRIGPLDIETGNRHDLEAYGVATEVLARFGHRFKSKDWTEITFPDGSVGYVPKPLANHINKTIDRLSSIGWARGTMSARRLTPARINLPMGIEPEYTAGVKAKMTTAKAVDVLANLFPATFAHIKMGVTTGIGLPNPAYFTANFMGGALQLFTGTGPIGAAKVLIRNPAMTASIMARLWKEGNFTPGNAWMVAKDGSIYTADQLTELAHIYGLKSSFIQAETRRAMAEDVEIMLRKRGKTPIGVFRRGMDGARWWQDTLTETATALDNFYRVSVFLEQIENGASAGAAAKLARRVAFDYSELSEFEKRVMRNVVLFYSYMRKNMDLTIDTLLTNPSRIVGQLRLTRGIQQINIEDDTELVLKDYLKERMAVGFKAATVNTKMTQQWMYIAPPIPIMDAINLPLNIYGWMQDDPESKRFLITRFAAPWVQYPFVDALEVDPFYGQSVDQFNRVPPWLVELDLVLLGKTLHNFLDIQNKPNFDPSRRNVEGDYFEGWYHANNGVGWWMYRNLLQIPGAGRSLDTISYLDRSNLGAVEGALALARALRNAAEAAGLAEELKDPHVGLAEETMGPRPGLTEKDEFMGLLGFKPTAIPTEQAAKDRMIKDWLEEAMKQPGIIRQSDWRRPYKRR